MAETDNKAGNSLTDRLRMRVADYSLGICKVIKEFWGEKGLREVLKKVAEDSARDKAKKINSLPEGERAEAMKDRLLRMLEEFGTSSISVNEIPGGYNLNNPNCGCLLPFIKQAEQFDFTKEEARGYACQRCMPSYASGTKKCNLTFEGKLTASGCIMQFTNLNYKNKTVEGVRK